jgi:hypothetical protein
VTKLVSEYCAKLTEGHEMTNATTVLMINFIEISSFVSNSTLSAPPSSLHDDDASSAERGALTRTAAHRLRKWNTSVRAA